MLGGVNLAILRVHLAFERGASSAIAPVHIVMQASGGLTNAQNEQTRTRHPPELSVYVGVRIYHEMAGRLVEDGSIHGRGKNKFIKIYIE